MTHLRPLACLPPLLIAAVLPLVAQDADTEARAKHDEAYRIGIEDVVRVSVWGEGNLDISQKVRPDGMITVPLVNDVKVAGLTTAQVRETVSEKLKDYLRDPNVTVMIEEINSFRIYLLGEVNQQGPLQFYRPTRLLQAVAQAGGLTPFSKKTITILREEFGAEKRIEVDYKKLWAGDPSQENILLKPGDTLLFK